MIVNSVNLEKELLSKRRKFKSEAAIIAEVKSIFDQNDSDRNQIIDKLKQQSSTKTNQLQFNLLETDKIFSFRANSKNLY